MGETFNNVYETLRGAGQITEVETAQASRAMNRMNIATSESEYRAAAEDFRNAVNAGLKIIREKSNMSYRQPTQPAAAPAAIQPTVAPATSNPFSVTTPQQVKDLYKSGKLPKDQANAILDDMKARGLF